MPRQLTQHFVDQYELYHQKFAKPQIEVDWDAYQKDSEDPDKNACVCYIYTENLELRSLGNSDASTMHKELYGNAEVMKLYSDGEPRDLDRVSKYINTMDTRWKSKMPFTGFVAHKDDDLVGAALLGQPEDGNSELSYLGVKKHQGKGYGREYIGSVVFDWTKYISDNPYEIECFEDFSGIIATSHTENHASIRVLEGFGFNKFKTDVKHSHMRHHYELPIMGEGGDQVAEA